MWVAVTTELPPLGVRVPVRGDYVREGTGHPIAYRREEPTYGVSNRRGWRWESTEWRGTVAVREWWRETAALGT